MLQDLKDFNGHHLLASRTESPLGLLKEQTLEPTSDMSRKTLISVEAHPTNEQSTTAFPTIVPPPRWKLNRNGKLLVSIS